jgi:hypothetical protein
MESNVKWKFPMNISVLLFGQKILKSILHQTELEFKELKKLCETEKHSTQMVK